MSAHPFTLPGRPRLSGSLVLVLVLVVSVMAGTIIAAPSLAAEGARVQVGVMQTEVGVEQPEPSAPLLSERGLSPLVVGAVLLMGAAMTATAGFVVVCRRRRVQ